MCLGKIGFVYLFAGLLFLVTKQKEEGGDLKKGNGARGVADTEHHMGLGPQNTEQMKTLTLTLLCLQF